MSRRVAPLARAALAVVALAAAALVGCVALHDSFRCGSDAACALAGRAGFCEPDGACSVADASCPSGHRYGDAAGAQSGRCTTPLADLAVVAADLAPDDAGTPFVCPSFAQFCSGFENGLDGFTNELRGGNTSFEVSAAKPHHGARSLHSAGGINMVDGGGTVSQAAAVGRQFGNAGGGTVDVRAYYYLTAPLGNYGSLLWLGGNGLSGTGSTPLGTWYLSDPAGEHDAADMLPIGRWFCLEQLIEPAGAGQPSRVRLFVDGNAVFDLQSPLTGPVTDLWLGLVRGPGDSAQEVYVDDVIVASQRVGCE